VYLLFPETNGWQLETPDVIFAEAHENGQNPVSTEKRWRKHGWARKSDAEQRAGAHDVAAGPDDDKEMLKGLSISRGLRAMMRSRTMCSTEKLQLAIAIRDIEQATLSIGHTKCYCATMRCIDYKISSSRLTPFILIVAGVSGVS